MSFSENDLLQIIDQLYEAVLEPSLMDAAFQNMADSTGGFGSVTMSVSTGKLLFTTKSLDDVWAAYTPEWQALNSRTHAARRLGAVTGLWTLRDLLDPSEIARDPFHQDYVKARGLFECAAFLTTPTPENPIAISIERAFDNGTFASEQLDFLAKIGPHAARALAVSMRLQGHGSQFDSDLEAFVNRLDLGAIVMNRNGEVAALNASAEILLGDGLCFHQKRLNTSSHTDQNKLDRLLHAAFNQVIENIGSIALPRPSGKRALILQAVPLAKDYFPGQLTKKPGSVLVLIHDLEMSKGLPDSTALKALGLSVAEIGVATLVGSGLSPQDASEHLGITLLTVRTHLKNIYQKLDLQRQGDLVQLVTKLRMVK